MWNIYEHPWTLILFAMLVQLGLTILHIVKPKTRKLWHPAIPAAIILSGLAIDHFVKTDREKVNLLIDEVLAATAAEDIPRISALFAADYDDGYNRSKQAIMAFAHKWFSTPIIESNKLYAKEMEIRDDRAIVIMTVFTNVEPSHPLVGDFKLLQTTSKIGMKKYGSQWLINSAEITQVNNNDVHWGSF